MTASTDLGRTRSRILPGPEPLGGVLTDISFGIPYSTILGGERVDGYEVTKDATHPMFFAMQSELWRETFQKLRTNPFFKYLSTGGPFSSTKTTYLSTGVPCKGTKVVNSFLTRSYSGTIGPCDPIVARSYQPDPIDRYILLDVGARAIMNSKPGESMAELSQLIVELKREGLPSIPMLRGLQKRSVDSAAGEFLNYEFGWKPIVSEIYKLADNLDKTEKAWQDYVKRANVLQRRHIDYPSETTTTTEVIPSGIAGSTYPVNHAYVVENSNAPLIRERTTVVTRKFSAAFQYAVPDMPDRGVNGFVRKALELKLKYGLEVSPQLIWELTPWSWLVDWILPVGNFIDAVSDQFLGNMAMPWAYISEHRKVTDVYSRPGATAFGRSVGEMTVVYDYKVRIPASPFGFGIDWGDFSSKQYAILAAIGITR